MYSIKNLIKTAMEEDIGSGDITTDNIIAPDMTGSGEIIAKESLVIAGLDIARLVFEELDPGIIFSPEFADGNQVEKGMKVLSVKGKLRALLKGERIALNFLQRISGIATNVRSYVNALKGSPVRLVDTRKTAPGWRILEKYAVRKGGAYNHRMGLYDGVLIKDNHIAVSGSIANAVEMVRKNISHFIKIEVEAADMEQVQQALDAGADIIMLDNMDIPQVTAAVKLINKRAVVEVSGNVTIERLSELAQTGVDIISSGALTHSARSVDLSMRIIAV
ncbi:putative nicotinate-nucleotide pyrophosphorylase [Desulfonema limicola]|uniref:Probable nicotinate-nucleotide pyrophosphorylase [carboxylating] n=1 Tax=Desulfonema limicola TaxID=45656 RepID=A0A975BEL0_9BACT|nr:carboxylating nicotinate-nucleotide diphosphorylase [Desulfonema limicola]QTA83680.1 putative nicotinate-nucleotide pyrophosphorylase [Desulfonema limicola]